MKSYWVRFIAEDEIEAENEEEALNKAYEMIPYNCELNIDAEIVEELKRGKDKEAKSHD